MCTTKRENTKKTEEVDMAKKKKYGLGGKSEQRTCRLAGSKNIYKSGGRRQLAQRFCQKPRLLDE